MDILTAKGLVKYYGKGESLVKAVDHTSFSVEKGEFTAIVGTSGSGKTTLLNLIGGLDRPDEGKIIIDGQDISGMKPAGHAPQGGDDLPELQPGIRSECIQEYRNAGKAGWK